MRITKAYGILESIKPNRCNYKLPRRASFTLHFLSLWLASKLKNIMLLCKQKQDYIKLCFRPSNMYWINCDHESAIRIRYFDTSGQGRIQSWTLGRGLIVFFM